jgi:hypothetical protein
MNRIGLTSIATALAIAGACLLAVTAAATPCQKKIAKTTGQGGTTTTANTTTCTDGTPCGKTITYNPIVAECKVSDEDCRCCLQQDQYSYVVTTSCTDNHQGGTTCTSSAPQQTSGIVTTYVTVTCEVTTPPACPTCNALPAFPPAP